MDEANPRSFDYRLQSSSRQEGKSTKHKKAISEERIEHTQSDWELHHGWATVLCVW